MQRTICNFHLVLILALLLSACASRPKTVAPADPRLRTLLLSGLAYDDLGVPDFSRNILKDRPRERGAKFTFVQFIEERPIKSYEIAITDPPRPDMLRPIRLIFEWTGQGFITGLEMTGEMISEQSLIGHSEEAVLAALVIITAPIVIGTIGGFAIGVGASVPLTGEELKKIPVRTSEVILTFSDYEHDERGRLMRIKTYLYTAPHNLLVQTDYHYRSNDHKPSRTEIKSIPENRVRVLPEAAGTE